MGRGQASSSSDISLSATARERQNEHERDQRQYKRYLRDQLEEIFSRPRSNKDKRKEAVVDAWKNGIPEATIRKLSGWTVAEVREAVESDIASDTRYQDAIAADY